MDAKHDRYVEFGRKITKKRFIELLSQGEWALFHTLLGPCDPGDVMSRRRVIQVRSKDVLLKAGEPGNSFTSYLDFPVGSMCFEDDAGRLTNAMGPDWKLDKDGKPDRVSYVKVR